MIPIIKPVGDFCNLRCRYCFYNTYEQACATRMTDTLLEKVISECMTVLPGPWEFIWHGGEPLLAGLSFYQRAVAIQARFGNRSEIRNKVQTNATLVDDDWAEFFSSHDFKVGVSVDGARLTHDKFRRNVGDRGSFEAVIEGVMRLRSHGIEPGFIHTVTKSALPRVAEDFEFFSTGLNATGWGLNPFAADAATSAHMKSESLEGDDFGDYLGQYLSRWMEADRSDLRIREIENSVAGVLGFEPYNCSYNGRCADFFCVDYNGEVFPCDRSSHRRDLMYGDLASQTLAEILESPARRDYECRVTALPRECLSCTWKDACNNGCTMQRIGGIDGKFAFCDARQTLFEGVRDRLVQYGFNPKRGVHHAEE